MNTYDEAARWVALSAIPGLGSDSYRKLLAAFGQPELIFSASYQSLSGVVAPAIASRIVEGFVPPPGLAEWLTDPANCVVTLADEAYPKALLEIPDPPPLLYLKGRIEFLNQPALAVVGSRNATPQGMATAKAFARTLSDAGLCIISGLALGIDAAAHRGGLEGASSSMAVVGTGLDIVYPARNRQLAHEIAQRGALVSEFPLETPAIGANFPRRNRIISGLGLGCLIVEAALPSGSLITARFALEQGREVFAIPGSIHSPHSRGCHALIKQGAKLVECADDILQELNLPLPQFSVEPAPSAKLDAETGKILEALGFAPSSIDSLCERSGLRAEVVTGVLLNLELDGLAASLPGGFYQRLPRSR